MRIRIEEGTTSVRIVKLTLRNLERKGDFRCCSEAADTLLPDHHVSKRPLPRYRPGLS